MSHPTPAELQNAEITLADAFRLRYSSIEGLIRGVLDTAATSDPTVVARAGDSLDEYAAMFTRVSQDILMHVAGH